MKYYQLANGDAIPALGLGTWKSQPGEVYQAVKTAIQIGYRHIDCAPIYKNEPEVGQALKDVITSGLVKRSELWITSKLWNNAHKSEQVVPALQQTLTDLQLDYLDLFLIHWPVALKQDVSFPQKGADYLSLEEVPLAETWQGMESALTKSMCKHIGVSNFSQKKIAALINDSTQKPEVNQVESHPYLQQKDLLDYCNSEGILLTAYSPLGSGDRIPAMKKQDEPSLLKHPLIAEIAKSKGLSSAQVLIAWAITRDTIVIPKSVNEKRLKENFAAGSIVLTSEEMAAISSLEHNYRFVDGSFWEMPDSPYTVSNLWD